MLILNFYISQQLIYYTVLVLFSFSIFFNSKIGFINAIDIIARVHLNDFFINTYYYYWTSFWYIPIFVLSILFFISFLRVNNTTKVPIMFYPIIIILGMECLGYWHTNITYLYIDTLGLKFNILLTNSINKYHPFLFYVSILYFFKYSLYLVTKYLPKYTRFIDTGSLFLMKKDRFFFKLIILVTLYLGSWWALQEGSWGGWWNWDPSEVFGLIVMLFIVVRLHSVYNLSKVWKYDYDMKLFLLILLITYVFIQVNFSLVSHNFGIRANQYTNLSHFFLIYLMFIFGVFMLYIIKFNINFSLSLVYFSARVFFNKTNFIYLIVYIFLITSLLVLISFYPLICDFLKQLLRVEISNFNINISYIIFYLLLVSHVFFYRFSLYTYLGLLFISFSQNQNLIIIYLLIIIIVSEVYLLHMLLISFIALALLNTSMVWTDWSLVCIDKVVINYNQTLVWGLTLFTVNNLLVEVGGTVLSENLFNEVVWNFLWVNSTPEVHSFYHGISSTIANQVLLTGFFLQKLGINVIDNTPSKMVLVLDLLVVVLISLWFKKSVIIY